MSIMPTTTRDTLDNIDFYRSYFQDMIYNNIKNYVQNEPVNTGRYVNSYGMSYRYPAPYYNESKTVYFRMRLDNEFSREFSRYYHDRNVFSRGNLSNIIIKDIEINNQEYINSVITVIISFDYNRNYDQEYISSFYETHEVWNPPAGFNRGIDIHHIKPFNKKGIFEGEDFTI